MAVHPWVLKFCCEKTRKKNEARRLTAEWRASKTAAERDKRLRAATDQFDALREWQRTRNARARAIFQKPDKDWSGIRGEIVREFAEAQKLQFSHKGGH